MLRLSEKLSLIVIRLTTLISKKKEIVKNFMCSNKQVPVYG